jgi:hypothetical protein
MKILVLALALVMGVVSSSSADEVFNGCAHKRTGALRLLLSPGRCLPSEVPVSFRSGAATDNLNANVYDANGQYLGIDVLGQGVYVPSLRKYVWFETFFGTGEVQSDLLYYDTEDCTGTPYGLMLNMHDVFMARGKFYVPAGTGPSGTTIKTFFNFETGTCDTLDPRSVWDRAAYTAVAEVTLPFKTPIALPTTLEAPPAGVEFRLRR